MTEPSNNLEARIGIFVQDVLSAIGLQLTVVITETPDRVEVRLDGTGGEVLLQRKGAALDALQHILNSKFRRELAEHHRIVVDHQDFRVSKDAELLQTVDFLIEQAKKTGQPQEIGPLNAYARRMVHLAVAEDPEMSSESQGDARLKTVLISVKSTAS
jgi:spoIIIJ-associated protein